MLGLNAIHLMGSLVADPQMHYSACGRAITRMRVAVSRCWRDAEGQYREQVEQFLVVLWGRRAEIAHEHLKEGDPVYVQGCLQTSSSEGPDGQIRCASEVIARNLILLPQRDGPLIPAEVEEELE